MDHTDNNSKEPFDTSPYLELAEKIKSNAANTGAQAIIGATAKERELVARTLHHTSANVLNGFIKLDLNILDLSKKFEEQYTVENNKDLEHVTIFIDKVDQYSLAQQEKLIDTIQNNPGMKVIVSSKQSFDELIDSGRLASGLYNLISSSIFIIPPLRRKPFDFINLLSYLDILFAKQSHQINSDYKFYKELCYYLWPGAKEELDKALKTMSILNIEILSEESTRYIQADEYINYYGHMTMSENNQNTTEPDSAQKDTLQHEIKTIEKEFILKALEEASNDKNLAAQILGISTKLLVEKMHELEII